MTSKQVTSPPWNSRRLVHSKEMVWALRWSVALRTFYRPNLSLLLNSSFPFWNFRPRLSRVLLVETLTHITHTVCTYFGGKVAFGHAPWISMKTFVHSLRVGGFELKPPKRKQWNTLNNFRILFLEKAEEVLRVLGGVRQDWQVILELGELSEIESHMKSEIVETLEKVSRAGLEEQKLL